MALVSLRQQLDHATEHNYGLVAYNVNNMEQVHAIMQAADETNSPAILKGTVRARKYVVEVLRHLVLCVAVWLVRNQFVARTK